MSDPSGWQVSGPYIAAGVALAWNAWLTFHTRSSFGCAVSWQKVDSIEHPDSFLQGTLTGPGALVTLKNVGRAELYDVVVTYTDHSGWIRSIPTRGRLDKDESMEWGAEVPQRLDSPVLTDPNAREFERARVTVTWRQRPHGRRRPERSGHLLFEPLAENTLRRSRRFMGLRHRISDRLVPPPPPRG